MVCGWLCSSQAVPELPTKQAQVGRSVLCGLDLQECFLGQVPRESRSRKSNEDSLVMQDHLIFKYFYYITEGRVFRWVLDSVAENMLSTMTCPPRMRSYSYAKFVGGAFIVAWKELDREEYLTCTFT